MNTENKYAFADFARGRIDNDMDLTLCDALMQINGDLDGFNDYMAYKYGYSSYNSFEDNCAGYIMDTMQLDINDKEDKKEFEEEFGRQIDLGYEEDVMDVE